MRRPEPGYVDVARQLPIAYCLGMVAMSAILIIGDIVVPISS